MLLYFFIDYLLIVGTLRKKSKKKLQINTNKKTKIKNGEEIHKKYFKQKNSYRQGLNKDQKGGNAKNM